MQEQTVFPYLLSVLEQDDMPVVLCDLHHTVVYMNAASKAMYHVDLVGKSLKACHNEQSNAKIEQVVQWFMEDTAHNRVFTYHNEKANKDVYMIALRDTQGQLIGYYEKHEPRTKEPSAPYTMA